MAPKTTKTNNKGKNAKTKAPSINVTTVRPESSIGSGPSGITIPGDSQTTLMRGYGHLAAPAYNNQSLFQLMNPSAAAAAATAAADT